jgi:hypothetical protein
MPPLLDPTFEAQVQQVHAITSKPLNHIRSDLRLTKSVEATINRVLDGTFLKGTERDPTREAGGYDRKSQGAVTGPLIRTVRMNHHHHHYHLRGSFRPLTARYHCSRTTDSMKTKTKT